MVQMLPAGRPRLSSAELLKLVAPLGLDPAKDPVFVVGVRGYYRDSMGAAGRNDRGIYDDALFLYSPSIFAAFNGNTDPGRIRKGSGTGAAKGMASLKPGLWRVHRFDTHRAGTPGAHFALCQRAGSVTVTRDGIDRDYDHTGPFGINIHRGGVTKTNSEGCQTIPPAQWPAFIAAVRDQAQRYHGARWRETTIPYALLEGVA